VYPCDSTHVVCQIKLTDVIIISMLAAESGVEGARAKDGFRVEDVGGRDSLAAHLGHHS
jgi:hypothetical protein